MSSAKGVATWGAAGVVLAAVAWWRLDGLTRGTIWAEDGRNFLAGALRGESVFTPYEGYVHAVPRILAELTVMSVPVGDYAITMTALTVIVAAGIGLLVFGLSADLGISRGARVGLALITVLAPAVISEVSGNAANLHWFALWLAPWLLLARPKTWVGSFLLGVLAFLAAASEIQLMLFLPLLLVDVRDRRRWPIAAGTVLGLTLQLTAVLMNARESPPYRPSILSTLHGYALEVGGGAWLTPIGPLVTRVADDGWWLAYVLLIPFVLLALWLVVKSPQLRIIVAALVVGSTVSWTAGFMLNLGAAGDFAGATPEQIRSIGPLRHAVVPSMFLLAIAVLGADQLSTRAGAGRGRYVQRGAGAVIAVALIVAMAVSADGRGDARRSDGPAWRASVVEAGKACKRTHATSLAIKTAPDPTHWVLPVSCRRLLSDGG